MKNPVYWAVLVGMSILLMEQGKWRRGLGIACSGALWLFALARRLLRRVSVSIFDIVPTI